MDLTWFALTVGVLAMAIVTYLVWSILREPRGQRQMEKIADYIEEGATAFLGLERGIRSNAKKYIEGKFGSRAPNSLDW